MTTPDSIISWTKTDEAPGLATYSLLPIIRAYTHGSGIEIALRDISLTARILSIFPETLREDQKVPDELTSLGELVKEPTANIVKLPNISASIPQLKAAIKELRDHGYDIAEYPDEPRSDAEKELKKRYARALGSAVNPVLREGNSDRRAAEAVKQFAKDNPHRMGKWSSESKTHVSSMSTGDFFSNEQSTTLPEATDARIEFVDRAGAVTVLKADLPLQAGEIIDATFMSKKALTDFFEAQMQDAREKGVLFSLHMKATMMKISDPIIFGHCVRVYYKDVFEKHATVIEGLGVDVRNGLGDLYAKIKSLPDDQRAQIEADIEACYNTRPELAMVNSDKGITNLHVPSDVIIDASMPAMIRESGKMWGPDGKLHDTKAVIPDHSYNSPFQAAIDNCKEHGAFDPATMGTVPNVGLMAQKAEEYGSHDKTFQVPGDGTIRIVNSSGETILESAVEEGDIWRACQVKDAPVQDWIKLAVKRTRITKMPAIFWLNRDRAHDAQIIKKIDQYLPEHDTTGLDITIKPVAEAAALSLQRMREGKDTISVTGNILRDYNTDLFPILELGTSAKMLSIVPLMNGGGLFETGAGGSAPKHVQQFLEEGHLRWDSLGEFLALAESFAHIGSDTAKIFSSTLNKANSRFLKNNRSPSRKCGEIDNRGSHFYLALYWAQALADQDEDTRIKERFAPVAKTLAENETKIIDELNVAQGRPVDLGGYYDLDIKKATAAMRPSPTFNALLDSLVS